ncbi:Hypothetical predicted protein [Mytilus galloprovincialis]|uniref:Exonuclease domain-containing protein n=1 Tax=Mytilus galloprovincialis TaxID=29158 RepID=A0A8B6HQW2_MYTGA|nr:Hypothetical predicted protein [Mytilus galloprovincialis]
MERNKMYVRGQIVEPVSLHKALLDFIHFLKEQNQPIILGHNICNFDIPVIVNKLKEYNLFSTFCKTVKGFIDTMKVATKYFPKHDVENFKQQTLVKQFVGENYLAHNAIEDVDSLKTLYDSKLALLVKSDDVFAISYHNCMDSYSGLLSSKIVSRPVCIQLAKDGISLKHLKLASVRDRTFVYITAGPQTNVLGMPNTQIIQTVPGQNVSAAHTGVYPAGMMTQQYPVSTPQFTAAAPGQGVNNQSPPPYKI